MTNKLSKKKGSRSQKLDHIGIAVNSIDETIIKYQKIMNVQILHKEILETKNLGIAFLDVGGQKLELLEPLANSGTIYKFIQNRGEGLHHLAFKTKNIYKEFDRAKKKGLTTLSEGPFEGAWNKWVFFIHPKDANGVLIEYCQKKKKK